MPKKILNKKSKSNSEKNFSLPLSFKQVMIILVVVPVVIVLFFSITSINKELELLRELRPLSGVSQLSSKVGAYVHEMQKERGATGGFMGSDGQEFIDVLKDQRELTDNSKVELNDLLDSFDPREFGERLSDVFNIAFAEYTKLNEIRRKVDLLSISDSDAIDFYTQHNEKMLDVVRLIATQTIPDVELTGDINAYVALTEGKEKAGEERALMTNTFASDKFDEGVADKFSFLVHAQEIFLDAFSWYASQGQIDFFNKKMSDPVVAEVERMRNIAFSKSEDFEVDALHWFLSMTAKIDLMQETADRVLNDITEREEVLIEQAQGKLRFVMFGMIAILFVTLSLSIYLTNFISRRINNLRKGAEIIGGGNLNYKVGTDDKDEIGQLSRAFDKMTLAIKQSRTDVDKKVREQTKRVLEQKKEVEKAVAHAEVMNEAMTGRELKMIELKKEISDLKNKNKNSNNKS
jgi:methyl-accepting chemotaxis protein